MKTFHLRQGQSFAQTQDKDPVIADLVDDIEKWLSKEQSTVGSQIIKNPDEIVLEDVKMVHYETMEEGRAVWLGIYLNNGKMYHLNIGGDNLYVNYSDETT